MFKKNIKFVVYIDDFLPFNFVKNTVYIRIVDKTAEMFGLYRVINEHREEGLWCKGRFKDWEPPILNFDEIKETRLEIEKEIVE